MGHPLKGIKSIRSVDIRIANTREYEENKKKIKKERKEERVDKSKKVRGEFFFGRVSKQV